MALVTVSKFNSPHEAELARLALESEGIPAFVIDAYTGGLLREMTTGGVRLQVDESDVEDADQILNRMTGVAGAEYATPSDAGPWEPPQTCPSCGAPDVVRRQKWIAFGIIAIFVAAIAYVQDATLVGFFIIGTLFVVALVGATWRCRNCGHTW